MQTKHLFVLIHILASETGLGPPVKYFLLTVQGGTILLLWIIFVIYVLCLSCFRDCSLLPCGHLLAVVERPDLLALVCGVKLCFCYFPMWYPGYGVVLDSSDS